MTNLAPLPLFALSCVFAACTPSVPAASSGDAAAPGPAVATAVAPAPLATPATPDELKGLARSNNAFALDFYARARAQKGNLALSPFSIATALEMTWAGARGETAAQMRKVLHLEGQGDRVLDVTGSLIASYGAPDQKVTLRVADRLFGDKGYAFEAPFLDRVKAAFGAPLEPTDFKNATEASRGRINAWVSKETSGRIQDLIPPNGVTGDTRLVLTNAVYFLGDWAAPFSKESTRSEPFSTSKADRKSVPTMHEQEHLHFAAVDGVKLVELPYVNGALAMTLVLPDAVDGIDDLEARLTPAVLDRWLGAAASAEVVVSLPRLEIAPTEALSLGDTLAGMGMPDAFDRGKADFTGIANPPNREDRLYIAKVFHKAFVKMDEKGTEAAAATAVAMPIAGAAAPTAQPQEFKADHPFLFLLRDTRSGMILFMGRVSDPASK